MQGSLLLEESRAEEQSADPLGTSSPRTRRGNNGGTDRGVRVGNATKPCKITRVGESRRERRRGSAKVEGERARGKEKKGKEKLETRLPPLLAGTAGGWNVG